MQCKFETKLKKQYTIYRNINNLQHYTQKLCVVKGEKKGRLKQKTYFNTS